MADAKPAERIVLKILAGVQSGAEVSLEPGEYTIGSGPDDDIQFIDVSMKSGHLRARLAAGKIEIRNGAGCFSTAAGLRSLASNGEWQELQPLDVVAAGATRFALGPPTAQWSTITDQSDLSPGASTAAANPAGAVSLLLAKARSLASAASLLAFVLVFFVALLLLFGDGSRLPRTVKARNEVATLRAALSRYAFECLLSVRQDVDGSIYVTGYVASKVERRAVTKAIEQTGIAVRLRLGVLHVLRDELDGLIKAEHVAVTYDLDENGRATLKGVVLAKRAADRFVADVRQNVVGLSGVRSHIETATDLFGQIKQLAHLSQIDDAVVFRLNGVVVEANGLISSNKIDQWVGFLQAYSKRFGDKIGLRSYVALQSRGGGELARGQLDAMTPILLGVVPDGKGADLEARRLKSGSLKLSDAFVGLGPTQAGSLASKPLGARPPLAPNRDSSGWRAGPIAKSQSTGFPSVLLAQGARATSGPHPPPDFKAPASVPVRLAGAARRAKPHPAGRVGDAGDGPSEAHLTAASGAAAQSKAEKARPSGAKRKPPPGPRPATSRAILPATFRHDVGDMADLAGALIGQWLAGDFPAAAGDASKVGAIERALDTLANRSLGVATPPDSLSEASKELFAHKFLPLFALSRRSTMDAARECRRGSRLSLDDLPAALFWLDLMSTTNAIALRDFSPDAQGFILEAALNPELDAECLRRDATTAPLVKESIYLAEAQRNPEFVRFVTQSIPAFALDVTGASLLDPRFVQLRDGGKLREGEAPDAASRIDTIGELGLSILLADGFATLIYPPEINWLAAR